MSKKLTRTKDGSTLLAGVCGGLAKYFNMDATIMRLLWVVFGLVSAGTALVVYLILALIIDVETPIG